MENTMVIGGHVWRYMEDWRCWVSGNTSTGVIDCAPAATDGSPDMANVHMVDRHGFGTTVEFWDAVVEALPAAHQLVADVLAELEDR